ncbi:hypothetical protein SESBI_25586 [Sesbania bispinosa]|nr:hypothetical protein SESBI_25586 [Sesbania bispinosa]
MMETMVEGDIVTASRMAEVARIGGQGLSLLAGFKGGVSKVACCGLGCCCRVSGKAVKRWCVGYWCVVVGVVGRKLGGAPILCE